jgi:hypothetical protein
MLKYNISSEGLGLESNCCGKARKQLQTHPLVREGAPQQETRICQRENKNVVIGSRWEINTKTE